MLWALLFFRMRVGRCFRRAVGVNLVLHIVLLSFEVLRPGCAVVVQACGGNRLKAKLNTTLVEELPAGREEAHKSL